MIYPTDISLYVMSPHSIVTHGNTWAALPLSSQAVFEKSFFHAVVLTVIYQTVISRAILRAPYQSRFMIFIEEFLFKRSFASSHKG